MIMGPARLAFLAAVALVAVMLVLGSAGRAEAHGLPHHSLKSVAPGLAAPDATRAARPVFALETEVGIPVAAPISHEIDGQPLAPDTSDGDPCCGGALCHAGAMTSSPTPWLRDPRGAKMPLPSGSGSLARMSWGIERPPRCRA
jgi:hypothetical protein